VCEENDRINQMNLHQSPSTGVLWLFVLKLDQKQNVLKPL